MTPKADILELPLHVVGVSDQVVNWLREAGFPVVLLGQESPLKSAFRSKINRSAQTLAAPKRCLIYDSRDVWSRTVVKNHQKTSLCKLDVARMLAPKGQQKSVRFSFLDQLKKVMESTGGIWARLADLPFPYQGVGLNGKMPNAELLGDIPANPAGRLDVIQKRYIAGLPSQITPEDLTGLSELPPMSGLQSPGLPLLWRADPTDFAAWWHYRARLQLKLWQSETYYRIDCPQSNTNFCPVLEIWRGNHLASIPLRSESLLVRKDGLVFQQQPLRHPAGFTTSWPDNPVDLALSRLSV